MIAINDILIVACLFVGAMIFDNFAYWKMANWSRQFRGESPKFNYINSLFPRVLLIVAGSILLYFAKLKGAGQLLWFVAAMVLILSSSLILYWRLIIERND